MNYQNIRELDQNDSLGYKRDEFELPDNLIYLDGNSLGPLPTCARHKSQQLIEQQWGHDLVSSWNLHHWIDLPIAVGEKIACLVGAQPGQVICCDSVSINLFKLLVCAVQLQQRNQGERRILLSQRDNFPTDLYVAEGVCQLLGKKNCELTLVNESEIEQALTEQVAVLLLTQVNFRNGRTHDIQHLTQLAHEQGVLVIWDLSHSVGVLPIQLNACNVDFAVGCGYKYLNGGPGAPAFLYAAKRHLPHLDQPLKGWMGHRLPFEFDEGYAAAEGIAQFQCGTPPVISMAVLGAALDVYTDVTIDQLRAKSIALSQLFWQLLQQDADLAALKVISPRKVEERGSHLALTHPSAFAICQALIERRVIADFRSPNILRIGFSPLFQRFEDLWNCVQILSEIMRKRVYEQGKYRKRLKVT